MILKEVCFLFFKEIFPQNISIENQIKESCCSAGNPKSSNPTHKKYLKKLFHDFFKLALVFE